MEGAPLALYETDAFVRVWRAAGCARYAEFVRSCAARFGPPRLGSGVELACGAALLSAELAAGGLRMTAVDRSQTMLAEARQTCAARGVDVALVLADMVDYRAVPPADLVINLGLNSTHLTTQDAMSRHLEAAAGSLRPGGLYLADHELCLHRLPPPVAVEPPWLVYAGGPLYVARGGGVEIRLAEGEIRYDPIRQTFRTRNTVAAIVGGVLDTRVVPSEGELYLPLELRALIDATGRFEFLGWYRDYRLDAPLDRHPDADRFIVVLRRRPS